MSVDSSKRFSNRVGDYVKYRPGYPAEIIPFLEKEIGLNSKWVVADIGSGTGKSAELFLKSGNTVYGIEPNDEMRNVAEEFLSPFKKGESHDLSEQGDFISLNGTAENTTLPDQSIDVVVAAQAFHWFDKGKTKQEFQRILKSSGWIVLLWNDRKFTNHPFAIEYEEFLLKYGTDYKKVNHRQVDDKALISFFEKKFNQRAFYNFQQFDFDGLKGRLTSSSYVPARGERGFDEMIDALELLFQKHQQKGKVLMEYDTRVFYGRVR
ncbi:MAG: SAM-dependent methyltransferase [Flavobacteriales bacterium]|nr:MAG: SAM-dependent methyltransferase [Flavobacteriales bacterium]